MGARTCILILLFFALIPKATSQEIALLKDISQWKNWEEKVFEGKTNYEWHTDSNMVCASSHSSASARILKKEIDLEKTPILKFKWSIKQKPKTVNELEKQGDDFSARVYVIVDGGAFFWNTKALNYVVSTQRVGKIWNNPFAGEAVKMLSLRQASSTDSTVWYEEIRNVKKDLEAAFWNPGSPGSPFTKVHAVAIMSDSDNSKSSAQACFADLRFSNNQFKGP